MILSALGRRSATGRTIGTVGLVLSIIALVLAIVIFAVLNHYWCFSEDDPVNYHGLLKIGFSAG